VNTDLDDITTRLIACMRAAAATVPDEAPPWDPAPRLAPIPTRGRRRRVPFALAGAAALAAVIAATLATRATPTAARVRSRVIAAAQHTAADHTARLQVTSEPIGGPTLVATGLVDFDTPAYTATYPSGFSWITIGGQTWTTVWPLVNPKRWVVRQTTDPKQWPNATEADLAAALQPDTAPAALIAALRADTPTFADLGVDQIGGLAAHRYRSTQNFTATHAVAWEADVWIAAGQLVRVEVRTTTGTVIFDYSDYGLPVTIQPPNP